MRKISVATTPPNKTLTIKREGTGKIFSHIRKKWLIEKPEERVRQEYVCTLVNEYGYSLDQMGEEIAVTERGSAQARADIIIWRSTADKANDNTLPLVVVECKADNVQIVAKDYTQGANYAQYCKARFFVTHNNRETKYWKVDHARRMPNFDEIENIPHADASDREIDELVAKLRVFKEEEFAALLQRCHDVIRNREAHDPTKAFDETAKILFVKVWVERELKARRQRKNLFSVRLLDEQVSDDPINDLFSKTKKHYEKDALFAADERINLKPETSREIVRLLERYNLSDTSEDIKGIAFEKFLGETFRGEIGQFFTPRPIVEFMIQMLDPQEGDVICDPAAGSGGFLIRFFEIVRQKILRSADAVYREFEQTFAADANLSEEEKGIRSLSKYNEIQAELDQRTPGSRLWSLANRCIYGTDKNDRMARTSKMNMIMHGDGHGGVHHWNGFLNVNGIFEERFDIVLTNPPFGSKLAADEKVLAKEIDLPETLEAHYAEVYGEPYRLSREALKAAVDQPISSLFDLPLGERGSIKTEILFIERCLDLLRPGGRMGLVLPEGIFNNPSVTRVRHHVEDRAKLLAVVSLPPETFVASGATVKTSLLFLRKFTESEKRKYDQQAKASLAEERAASQANIDDLQMILDTKMPKLADILPAGRKPTEDEKADATEQLKVLKDDLRERKKAATRRVKEIEAEIKVAARKRLRQKVRYPVFLYDAERVGITATGTADDNELLPMADDSEPGRASALEEYRRFQADNAAYVASGYPAAEVVA